MQQRTYVLLISVIVCLLGAAAGARAQTGGATTATVAGVVKDTSGAVIGGAVITARQIETNLERNVVSNEDGSYTLVQLPPGNYEITAKAEGFALKLAKIPLVVGATALNDFTLQAGGDTEVIEVSASEIVAFEPSKTEKSDVIGEEQVQSLPIDRRSFLDFALTTSAVTVDPNLAQGAQATSQLSINGQNARQNNITIDGFDNNDNYAGSVRSGFSQEAIKEFRVITNSFAAEFGRAQGGIVNVVTKSGTNDYHGSLFLFFRNDELSARRAFAATKPPLRQYQFGSTLGGAIKKDRIFFFTAFERFTQARNTVITVSQAVIDSFNRVGFPAQTGLSPFSRATTSTLGRLDIKVNDYDQLSVRYNYTNDYDGVIDGFGASRVASAAAALRLRDDNIAVSNTLVSAGLNLVNETRFIYGRRDLATDPVDKSGPRVSLGFATAGRSLSTPSPRFEHIYQLVNNVSLQRGRNQLKFGVDYLHVSLPEDSNQFPIGAGGQALFRSLPFGPITLSTLQAFDPAVRTPTQQAFLAVIGRLLPTQFPGFPILDLTKLSLPFAFTQGFGSPFYEIDYDYFSTFAQNDLRINPKLLVKLGVRYDLERVKGLPKNDGNFSPRISLAYRINDRLSYHASYGIFHGIIPFAAVANLELGRNGYQQPIFVFPFSIIPFAQPGRRFADTSKLPASIQFSKQLSIEQAVDANLRNGYAQHVHTGFDLLVDNKTVVSVSYQYLRGVKLYLSRNINPVVRPRANPVDSLIFGRLDPTRGQVQELESAGDSYYNALTLEARRRFGSNFAFLASYTYSKTIDNFNDFRIETVSFQNPLNLREERALSQQDLRHRFLVSGLWSLNYTKNPLLRDFRISTIVRCESGQPYNLFAGTDLDRNGDNPPADRPNRIGRNAGELPGFANVDIRVTRLIKLNERVSIEGFAEAFNAFNRVNITESLFTFPPNANGTFNLPKQRNGRFVVPKENQIGSGRAREFQLGFRLAF